MSSDNYAGRLSEYKHKGICGLPEKTETKRSLESKITKLIPLMNKANHIVVLTGAGISTKAGIPDFRGPNGIWTKENQDAKKRKLEAKQNQQRGRRGQQPKMNKNAIIGGGANGNRKKLKCEGDASSAGGKNDATANSPAGETCDTQQSTSTSDPDQFATSPLQNKVKTEATASLSGSSKAFSFSDAKPTLTHRAITKLTHLSKIKYTITQNVDGLHMRSGIPRDNHCFLHGCIFTEKCEDCGEEYFRDYDIGGVSFQKTGRFCEKKLKNNDGTCGGCLRDTVLDWEDDLPQKDWVRAQEECMQSDLVLALGTSLRIEPAGSLPTLADKFVIVNKQVTPYDNHEQAVLKIRADVDYVFERIMDGLDCVEEGWDQERP